MSVKKPRPASSVLLTDRDRAIADAVLDNKTMKDVAAEAGCTPDTASKVVKTSHDVQGYIEDHRREISNATQLKRADMIAGMMEAIDVARLAADPGSMIRGWSEIGKALGFYAPEKVEVTLNINQRNIQSKFEVMSDDQLLAIAEGRVYEGECSTIQ
jgi:DNA-binding CsgD family transcriptional regulator